MAKRIMAHNGSGFNEQINRIKAHNGSGFNQVINRVHGHTGTEWEELWPGSGTEPLPPGEYILPPTSLWLPTNSKSGYAEFDTVQYRGSITEIRQRVSWKGLTTSNQDVNTSGRPNGNFYRNIANNGGQWNNRTIDHRIDSFDATSLTDFNSGAAIGFSFTAGNTSFQIGNLWSNVQLNLTIS